jgi:hypothetical protein
MAHAPSGARLAALTLGTLLPLAAGGAARAQDQTPAFELYGGYAFLRDLGDPATNLPAGWSTSFAWNPARSIGVVFDIGGNYKSEAGLDFNQHAFLGGLRYSLRGTSVTPYFEVLGGVVRGSGTTLGVTATVTDPAVQGGVGVAFYLNERLSVRAGVDYRNIFSEGDSFQQFRAIAGLSYGFGGGSAPRADSAPPPMPSSPAPTYTSAVEPPPARPQPVPAPESAAPVTAPQPMPRVQPGDPLGRARGLLNSGDYAGASDAFRSHLRTRASFKYTIAVGLFCDATNLAQAVGNAGGAAELMVLSLPRRGPGCYGMYWGLYDSRAAADQALGTVPATLRAAGPATLAVSQILR